MSFAASSVKRHSLPIRKDGALFYTLLFLVFWLPLPLGSNRPWAWACMELICYFLLSGAVWVYRDDLLLRLKAYRLPIVLLLIFLAWNLIQFIPMPEGIIHFLAPARVNLQQIVPTAETSWLTLSVDPAQTRISFYKSMAYVSLFVSALLLLNQRKRIIGLMLCIVAAGTLQALYGALESLSGITRSPIFNLPVTQIATGSFVYKNHYANFLMLCLCVGIGYMVSTLGAKALSGRRAWMRHFINTLFSSKALVRISLAIMVIALVMSRSRMGNSAFFAAMTITGVLGLLLIKNRGKSLTVLIISLFIIDIFILSAWFGLDKVQERLEQTSLTQESRDEVVLDAIEMLPQWGITGAGMGSFYGLFPGYQGTDVVLFYDQAHNDYLQFALEAGIPVTLILAGFLGICFWSALRAMATRRKSLMRGMSFACIMAIIGMLTHMTVDFPLQAPANTAYFVLILALSLISIRLEKQPVSDNTSSLRFG